MGLSGQIQSRSAGAEAIGEPVKGGIMGATALMWGLHPGLSPHPLSCTDGLISKENSYPTRLVHNGDFLRQVDAKKNVLRFLKIVAFF